MNYKPSARSTAVTPSNGNDMMQIFNKMKPELSNALPKSAGLTADRMVRILLTEVRKTPDLLQADRSSFLGAVMQCAQLGLEPGNGLGHAYLLPFRNKGRLEVQFIMGYQGMIELAERSGMVTVDAQVVYEKDEFDYSLGLNQDILHKPYIGSDDPGEVVAAYAVGKYRDGRVKFRVITRREIDEVKASSKSGKSQYSPWNTHFAEMARKTAIRRIFKMLPKSTEIRRALDLDERDEIAKPQNLELMAPEYLVDETVVVENSGEEDNDGEEKQES